MKVDYLFEQNSPIKTEENNLNKKDFMIFSNLASHCYQMKQFLDETVY